MSRVVVALLRALQVVAAVVNLVLVSLGKCIASFPITAACDRHNTSRSGQGMADRRTEN